MIISVCWAKDDQWSVLFNHVGPGRREIKDDLAQTHRCNDRIEVIGFTSVVANFSSPSSGEVHVFPCLPRIDSVAEGLFIVLPLYLTSNPVGFFSKTTSAISWDSVTVADLLSWSPTFTNPPMVSLNLYSEPAWKSSGGLCFALEEFHVELLVGSEGIYLWGNDNPTDSLIDYVQYIYDSLKPRNTRKRKQAGCSLPVNLRNHKGLFVRLQWGYTQHLSHLTRS